MKSAEPTPSARPTERAANRAVCHGEVTCIRAARQRPDVEGHPEVLTRAKAGSRSVERASSPGPPRHAAAGRRQPVARAPAARSRSDRYSSRRAALGWLVRGRDRGHRVGPGRIVTPVHRLPSRCGRPRRHVAPYKHASTPRRLRRRPWTITGRWIRASLWWAMSAFFVNGAGFDGP